MGFFWYWATVRVPILLMTKNPGLFRDFPGHPRKIFQDLFRMFKYKEKKRHSLAIFRV